MIPLLGIASCQTPPAWDAKFWAGDSANVGVTRCKVRDEQKNCIEFETIHAAKPCMTEDPSEPCIDNGLWMLYLELEKLKTEVLDKCEQWRNNDIPAALQ